MTNLTLIQSANQELNINSELEVLYERLRDDEVVVVSPSTNEDAEIHKRVQIAKKVDSGASTGARSKNDIIVSHGMGKKVVAALKTAGYSAVQEDGALNEGVLEQFKRVLAMIKRGEAVSPEEVGALMGGLKVLSQPEAAEAITPDLLKQIGATANVREPKTIELVDQNKSVRDSIIKIGQNYAKQTTPKYVQMVKQAVESKDVKAALVGAMKEILGGLKKKPSIGIKQQVDQKRQAQGGTQANATAEPAAPSAAAGPVEPAAPAPKV